MKPIDENQRNRYFTELAVALKREGLETMPLKDWQLPVLMDGHPICQISGGGNVRYRPEDVAAETMEQALQKATDTAETVSEYMRLMEALYDHTFPLRYKAQKFIETMPLTQPAKIC